MKQRIAAISWLIAVAVLASVLIALTSAGKLNLQTRLTSLLPKPAQSPSVTRAINRLATTGDNRLVLLIRSAKRADRQQAAQAAADALRDSGAFKNVAGRRNDLIPAQAQKQIQQLYFDHRFHLLAPADRAALADLTDESNANDAAARQHFLTRARRRLATPGFSGGQRFLADPLGLSRAYIQHTFARNTAGVTETRASRLTATGPSGNHYAVVLAQSTGSPFSMTRQGQAETAIADARAAALRRAPEAGILISGAIRHAAAASSRARHQMSVVGLGSILGITGLMIWLFASLRPLAASLLVVAGGVLTATLVTRLIFGDVHVLTLVFGASLVGVAIDYCLHFYAERWRHGSPARTLAAIRPAITLGLITSASAYGAMAIAPFPGLRQIATFTAVGLGAAWLGVLMLLPALAGPTPRRGRALGLAKLWLSHGPGAIARNRPRTVILGFVGVIIVAGSITLVSLQPDDGLGALYNPPDTLVTADRQVADVLGASMQGLAILVRADTPEQTLSREQAIIQQLQHRDGSATRVRAITNSFAPPEAQRQSYRLLAQTLYATEGPVTQLLQRVGYPKSLIQRQLDNFQSQRGQLLPLKRWLASPAGKAYRGLWLGQVAGHYASLVRLQHVADMSQLRSVVKDTAHARLIDRPAQISTLLHHYRYVAGWLLVAAYALAWILLTSIVGARRAALIIAAPLTASLVVTSLFALTGWAFTIFNVMALLLLLGLGADYGIFLRFADSDKAPAMTASAASMATTVLAFGLLSLSATPALHQFGVTLGIGVVLTFVLATLASAIPLSSNEQQTHD